MCSTLINFPQRGLLNPSNVIKSLWTSNGRLAKTFIFYLNANNSFELWSEINSLCFPTHAAFSNHTWNDLAQIFHNTWNEFKIKSTQLYENSDSSLSLSQPVRLSFPQTSTWENGEFLIHKKGESNRLSVSFVVMKTIIRMKTDNDS